jgi:diguanylate cyclase (GGDEF)-like protein
MKKIRSSLQIKVLLIVLGIFISIGALELAIKQYIIYPSFAELELNEARSNLERCKSAIDREIYHLDKLNHDWSAWTDTYEYVQDLNTDYEESNLIDDTFISAAIHLLFIINDENDVVWKKVFDTNFKNEIELDSFNKDSFEKGHPLLKFEQAHSLSEKHNAGVIATDYGPLLISSRPILDSNNEGPSKGIIFMGKFLSEEVLQLLKSQVRVDFQIILPDKNNFHSLSSNIDKNKGYHVQAAEKFLTMYANYKDINSNPAFIIETNFPRKITQKGFTALRTSMIVMVFSSIIVLSIVLYLLRIFILKPISTLTKFTANIKENRDFGSRVKIDRSDEIGTLSDGVNDMLGTIVEQTDLLITANLKLQKSSSTDGLTGIPNRRTFDETYGRDWSMHGREKKPLGLILCDIDFFKPYNDTYGHQKGDQCLKKVAKTIQNALKRTNDLAARYGGEEFVIILPNTDLEGAIGIAQIIRKNVEAAAILHKSSTVGEYVTISLGVGSIVPPNDMTSDQFLECVDKALYQSKENGRNQVGVIQR